MNGKMYAVGAGITQVVAGPSIPLALALFWNIAWERANQVHDIELTLVTEDGAAVPNAQDEPIKVVGKMEVGRPPGAKRGAALPAPVAVRLGEMPFTVGGYRWEFRVNGSLEAVAVFNAVGV